MRCTGPCDTRRRRRAPSRGRARCGRSWARRRCHGSVRPAPPPRPGRPGRHAGDGGEEVALDVGAEVVELGDGAGDEDAGEVVVGREHHHGAVAELVDLRAGAGDAAVIRVVAGGRGGRRVIQRRRRSRGRPRSAGRRRRRRPRRGPRTRRRAPRRPGRRRRAAGRATVVDSRTVAPAAAAASSRSLSRTVRRTQYGWAAPSTAGGGPLMTNGPKSIVNPESGGAPEAATRSNRPHCRSSAIAGTCSRCVDSTSLGNVARSSSSTRCPWRARSMAVGEPATRAPTTIASKSMGSTVHRRPTR